MNFQDFKKDVEAAFKNMIADRDQAKQKAAEKAKLLDLLDKKQSEKLENLSEEELRQRLAELG